VDLLRSYIVNENQLRGILEVAKEGRNIEFKGGMPWSNPEFRAKITKSILAFSNVRDGGAIIIGVEEPSDGVFDLVGVETQVVKTFSEEDVAAHVAEYADPYTKFTVQKLSLDDRVYVVVEVAEFDEIPVICKKDGPSKLRKGATYTRSYRIPESVEVPSQVEMREILDIAAEKKLRKHYEMQRRVGAPSEVGAEVSDDARFAAQREGLP
jgi:predicted HTH transcriptional regulator